MVYDSGRRRVVLFGGRTTQYWNDTWEYDGSSWHLEALAPLALTPRWGSAMAFDSARGLTILFGGLNESYVRLHETWVYDGLGWSPGPAAPSGLVGRYRAGMAYDSRRGVAVLFGGDDGGLRNDTWELSAAGWSAGAAPPADLMRRDSFGIAFDEARGVVVIFGGYQGSSNNHLDDTWEYDGVVWTEAPQAPLGDRWGQRMVYDSIRRRIVLFGGLGCPTCAYGDTWEYDGVAWLRGDEGASPRYSHSMAFDSARGRVVMVGGEWSPGQTTWEYFPVADFLTGQGLARPNRNKVKVHDAGGLPTSVAFLAYGANQWGVNVAAGTIDTEPYDSILTGPGPGTVYGPQVRGFSRVGVPIAKVDFFAYGTLKYGTNVTAGCVDFDSPNSYDEVLTGPGPGAVFGPHVRGWNYDGSTVTPMPLLSFFAYATPRFGVGVSGVRQAWFPFPGYILTGPGPSPAFGPNVRGFAFNGAQLLPLFSFDAYSAPGFGVNVSGSGSSVLIAAAPGPGPTAAHPSRYRGFAWNGSTVFPLPGFDVTAFPTAYGGRVSLSDIDSDVRTDLVVGAGPDPSADATVRTYSYRGGSLSLLPNTFVSFTSMYGVNVSGADLGL